MDYLVIEGYKSAAEEFCQEANLTPPVDFDSIESRMDIRDALQRGDVEDAIARVNDLNPEVRFVSLVLYLSRRRRIIPLCTTLRPHRGSVMRLLHQNFSLQYDSTLLVVHGAIANAPADPGHEPAAVLSSAAAKADRVHPARADRRGAAVCAGRAGAARGGEPGVSVGAGADDGVAGV